MKQLQLVFTLFLTLFVFTAFGQRQIVGSVTDGSGEGLIGASVQAKGTNRGTVTDANGGYRLDVEAGTTALVFSYVGYETKEIPLGAANVLNATLAEGLTLDAVTVIGSRNATRTKLETPVPVDIIPISQVANEVGQVDINQILTYIAPSFQSARQTIADGTDHIDPGQLRGLGPDQVLVLINGKRRHQSSLVNVNGTVNRGSVGTDLSAIPVSSIDRIEILRDGAAAQYGSDAIAGVINIVTKKSTGEVNATVSFGQHATSFEKNYAIDKLASKATEKVSANDGQNMQLGLNYGVSIGKKGFLNLTGEFLQRDATNRGGTYTGQIYPKNGAGKVVDDSIMGAKGIDRSFFDMNIGQSKVTGGSLFYNFENACGSAERGITLYSFGGFNRKNGTAAGFYRYPNAVPAKSKALLNYPDGFLPEINSKVSDAAATLGLRGSFGSGWNWDLSETVGQNSFGFQISNSVNYTQTGRDLAFQDRFDAGGTSFLQATTNADVAKNWPDILSGFNLGLGGEFRADQYSIRAGEEASWKNYDPALAIAAGSQVFAGFLPSNEGSNSRTALAGYVDAELDITKKLMIGAALRAENYSDFGGTFNYKAVARFAPISQFAIRGSASSGFRAPSMQQRFYAKTNTLFVSGANGLTAVEAGTFTNDSKVASLLGIPALKEETSQSFTAGVTVRPFDGLELSVDAYQIDINDRIVLTNNFSDGGNAQLKTDLAAAGAGAANVFSNAVDTRSRGLEGVISYAKKFGSKNEFRLTAAVTAIDNEVVKGADGKPAIKASQILIETKQVGAYFNREDQSRIEVAAPRQKAAITANLKFGKLGMMVRATYFGEVTYLDPINFNDSTTWPRSGAYILGGTNPNKYYDPSKVAFKNAFSGQPETFDQTFAPKTILDFTLSYQIAKFVNLAVGANNVLDSYQDRHEHSNNQSSGRFVYSRRVQQHGFGGRYIFARLRFSLKP